MTATRSRVAKENFSRPKGELLAFLALLSGNAALAAIPVPRRKVEQRLHQAVLSQLFRQHFGARDIGHGVFHRLEPIRCRGLEAV